MHLPLALEAKESFKRFLDEAADHAVTQENALKTSWLKLRPMAARFALIFSVIDQLERFPEGNALQPVDQHSTEAGIELAWWFGRELERNFKNGMRSTSDESLESHLQWIKSKHPDGIEPRQLQQGRRKIRTAEQARAIVQQLVGQGLGTFDGKHFVPNREQRGAA